MQLRQSFYLKTAESCLLLAEVTKISLLPNSPSKNKFYHSSISCRSKKQILQFVRNKGTRRQWAQELEMRPIYNLLCHFVPYPTMEILILFNIKIQKRIIDVNPLEYSKKTALLAFYFTAYVRMN
jgi:hypothetical protein